MDNNKTWIKLYRQILNHDLYNIKPFDRLHAWIDLLLLAEFKTKRKLWRGSMTEFKKGDVNLSIKKLADRWGWSRGKVERFLNNLSDMEMIHLNVHRNRTTITSINWDNFQNGRTSERTSKRASNDESERTSNEQSDDEYLKKDKEGIENKEKPSADPVQEEEEEIRWNGKRLEDLTEQEYFDYIDSWPDEEEQT